MTLAYTYDGAAITQKIAPSGINITHRADGDPSQGGLPIEDPAAALTMVGWKPVTVEESLCSQPRLFTGFTMQRDIGRSLDEGLFVGADPRLQDLTITDLNAIFGFRVITRTGTGGGNRPAETWADRLTWILESEYLNEWISADQTWVVTNTTMMEETDYRGAYAASVMEDLVDRSGGAYLYFAFYDTTAHEIRLFFDNESESLGLSTISISNNWDDVDNDYVFAPDSVAKLAREVDQVYSDVVVTYNKGTQKVYRYRPATATAYVRRGTEIQRPYTKGLATAEAQGDKWLNRHSIETDRITCSIQVPASRVGLIEAGQTMMVRFSHLPGYETGTVMRVVSYSPRPTNDVADFYNIALELVGSHWGPIDCTTTLSSTNLTVAHGQPQGTEVPAVASVTMTPTAAPALIFAWLAACTSAAPCATDMEEIPGYTTLVNIVPFVSGTTYTIAYRSEPAPSGSYTATAGFTTGFGEAEWTALQFEILTEEIAPVQDAWAGQNREVDLPNDPTPGNMIIMFGHHEWPGSVLYPDEDVEGTGTNRPWTTLCDIPSYSTRPYLHMCAWARCVQAGDEKHFRFWTVGGYAISTSVYVSEWALTGTAVPGGGGDDEVIPLPPAPGSTTLHTTDPTVNDDAAAGYTVGSTWINTTDGGVFVLVDSTTGAAVWVETSSGGTVYAPTTADYLVGTAQAGLSAEIVVGTTPGGELGGTWASPTVDATHSGSAHLALGSTGSTAAAGNHTHAGLGAHELLITDTPAGSPLVFADILQNEAGTDLLYSE